MNVTTAVRKTRPWKWVEHLQNTRHSLVVCKRALREMITKTSKFYVCWMLIWMIAFKTIGLLQPLIVSYIIDGLAERNLQWLLLGLIGFAVTDQAQTIFHYAGAIARNWVFRYHHVQFDQRITELLFQKSCGQHMQEGSQLGIANLEKGRWRIYDLQEMLLFSGISAIFDVGLAWLFLWFFSPIAGLITTIMMLVYLGWSLFINIKVLEIFGPVEQEERMVNRHRIERWNKVERVKTNGKEAEELQYLGEWFGKVRDDHARFWNWVDKHGLFKNAIKGFGIFCVVCYGVWLVWSGRLEGIGLFYPIFEWSRKINWGLWEIGFIEMRLNEDIPSVRSLLEAVSIPASVVSAPDAVQIERQNVGRISFDHVSYTYPLGSIEEGLSDRKAPLHTIRDVSFSIEHGEKVAVIGPSGAGKTTIMRLLLRYFDPDSGEIQVNGHRLHDIDLASWMGLVGYIPQHAQIFNDTVRYNLKYGLPTKDHGSIADEELWELVRSLKLDGRLFNGLDTLVGEDGVKLSGGESQRLMIGAAAIKKPAFMIIDEATSHLDSSTEKEVLNGLQQVLRPEVSALIIAHRLSTVRHYDKFILLRPASELAEGESQVEVVAHSFEELFETSPTFRKLSSDQEVLIA